MKKRITLLTLQYLIIITLLFLNRIMGFSMENGIYSIEKNNSTRTIKTVDNEIINIGVKTNYSIESSILRSTDNENQFFHLYINFHYNKLIEKNNHVLIVNGIGYKQSSWGSSHNIIHNLSFVIRGKDQADIVGKYFKIKPFFRSHPNHRIVVSFIPDKTEFSRDDEIWVKFRIKNIGTNIISFEVGGRNRAQRDNQYVFNCYLNGKQVTDIGTTNHFGGLSINKILKAGEIFETKINLTKWFSFKQTGYYVLLGSFYMNFRNPDNNEFITLWEEYVSSEFSVRIK